MLHQLDLRPYFTEASTLCEEGGDIMLCDRELSPQCGFLSLSEANVLYRLARVYGPDWCEIGSHVGWSAAHIAAAGNSVACVDPGFADLALRRRALENWSRCGLKDYLPTAIAATSRDFFAHNKRQFDGLFIDGCHDAPEPLLDAQQAMACLRSPGVIVLHDAKRQPIRDAANWLAGQGFRLTEQRTMNGLVAAER